MLAAADDLLRDDPTTADTPATRQVQRLQLLGTSMGGARPKTVVEDEEGLWLAKFSRPDDAWDNPRVEHAMLALAIECGLSASRSKIVDVGGRPVLFVKRFDRERVDGGYLRHRMISAVTFLGASESSSDRSRWSYPLLADELRRTDIQQETSRPELFRRMAFNALISNLDDHPRCPSGLKRAPFSILIKSLRGLLKHLKRLGHDRRRLRPRLNLGLILLSESERGYCKGRASTPIHDKAIFSIVNILS